MSPRTQLRGRARRRLLALLQRLADLHGVVSRAAVLREARRTGELGVNAASIEPTVNRLLRDLYELCVIDVSDVSFSVAPGLRAEIEAAVSVGRLEYMDQLLADCAPEDLVLYLPYAEIKYACLERAAASGSWTDARACRDPFRLRWIELHPAFRRR